MKTIYLDNAATTRMSSAVVNAMMPYFSDKFYNPSSIYSQSQEIKETIESCRVLLAKTINASTNEIFFTSCGSESNNWAILGTVAAYNNKKHIVTSTIEHHSTLRAVEYLRSNGFEVTYVDVDSNGIIKLDDLKNNIRNNTALVSIIHANNEIGTIEPIKEIGDLCHDRGVLFHVDAVQSYCHIPVDVQACHIDMLSTSAHKFGGPKGVGFLFKRNGVTLKSLISGGSQERNMRAGTENVAGIVGMAKAAEIAYGEMHNRSAYEIELRDYCIDRILTEIPYARLNGDRHLRLPNNVNISFQFIEGESLLLSLNKYGICASSGSACTSGALDPSHVLLAIGLTHEIAHGSLRLTISYETKREDIDFTIEKLKMIVNNLRSISPLYEDFKKQK